RLYGRVLVNPNHLSTASIYPVQGSDSLGSSDDFFYYNGAAAWFHNFGPASINEFRTSYDLSGGLRQSAGTSKGLNGQIGLKGVEAGMFGSFNVAGIATLGGSPHYREQSPVVNQTFADHFTMIRGSHSLKFGGEMRRAINTGTARNTAG